MRWNQQEHDAEKKHAKLCKDEVRMKSAENRRRILALSKKAPPVSPEELAHANKLIGKVFRGESLEP